MLNLGQTILEFLRSLITWLPGLALGVILHEYAHALSWGKDTDDHKGTG